MTWNWWPKKSKFKDPAKVHMHGGELAFHPDGKKLAVGSSAGVCVIDVPSLKPLWHWPSPGPIAWLDWAADGRHLVTHNSNMTLYVLRLNQFGPTPGNNPTTAKRE